MRPTTGFDAVPARPRKQSDPATFFLTRDPDSISTGSVVSAVDTDVSPVRTLKETLEEADAQSIYALPRHRQYDTRSSGSRRRSTIKPQGIAESRNDVSSEHPSTSQAPLGTLTPSVLTSQEPSLPGSPKSASPRSLAKSDDELTQDETGSQAITSSEDEHEEEGLSPEVLDSAPQLVMPSIKMPSRRPFTERGKQIGRFKIMVAGSKGSGRTSLVKSIVQLCEDIVHVDSVSSTSSHGPAQARRNFSLESTSANEIYASTKPYPFWWSELDESRVLKRRKSVGDAVLERNICFVDTIGSGRPERLISYLEQQFLKSINTMHNAQTEMTGLVSGRGGAQVDVVLYLLTKETLREDCDNMRRISQLCNVIPMISKSDLLPLDVITELKMADLPGAALPHLPFNQTLDANQQGQSPYSVSSANGSDFDNMDASLLMSPEYVRPLVPSELSLLVQQLFEPSTIEYLRYTSAKKLVLWYATEPRLTQMSSPSTRSPRASTLNSPFPTSLSNSGVLIPITSELSLNTSNSYALAKVADHTQREEHLAQIRLSKWASDLQLSLQRERERYEHLAQSERALWLVQRMGEEVRSGQVVSAQDTQVVIKANEKSRIMYPDLRYEAHDPLGLLRWQDTMRTRGWAALQIIGSFGVMGGVALWLAKTWGLTASLHAWLQKWTADLFSTNE